MYKHKSAFFSHSKGVYVSKKKIWEKKKKKKFSKEKISVKPKKRDIKALSKLGLIKEGTFIGNHKGFGFVELEEEEDDIFIPADHTGTAMHMDRVRVLLKNEAKTGKRREGTVIEILERVNKEIVGTFQRERDYGFILCDNQKFSKDIYISPKNSKGVRDGDKVVAEIIDYGNDRRKPEGKIAENLGSMNAPGTDILAIVKSFNIPSEFPVKVMNQAMRVPDHVQEADRDGRTDLTQLMTVTIDGEDAKDLDDAVSLTKEGNIYHLGVHIADVSNYVQGGSALDKEALKRGTSVYLADRVIPMLPERLSNGICSLNQGQDRLTLSCLMDIDENLSYDDFYLQGDNLYLVANNNSSYSYGCYNLLKLGMATNEMDCYLPFSENLAKQHSHWGLFSNISQYKDSLLIICSNNDTIYQSTKDGTSAKYAVHFSKRELPEDLRQKDGTTIMMTAMEKRYIKGLSSILNLDGYFIAQYGDYIMRSILYDKRTDEHTVANVLKLGKWGDLYMWEYSFSDDGKLIVADSGGAFLSSWKERYSNRTFIRSEDKKDLQKIYEQTSEEDNPIIGIFTLKNK